MASKINDNENLSNDGETDMNNDNEETSCVSSSSSGPKEQIENENRSTDQQSKTSEEESVTSSSGSNLDANKKPEANDKAKTEMSAKSSDENKTALQPKKRRPEKELNHDNWDEEEEPEEKGEFVKASEEKLKDRKIIKARRKNPSTAPSSTNPFGGLNLANPFGVASTGTTNAVSMFNFGSTLAAPAPVAPKFDFGCFSAKKDENSTQTATIKRCKQNDESGDANESSAKKLKQEETASDKLAVEDVTVGEVSSATTA